MNAKKIMGAVLVALLAAALFIGAGAAAEETAVGTAYLYNTTAVAGLAAGTYTCGDAAVTVNATGVVIPVDLSKFVDSWYKGSNWSDCCIYDNLISCIRGPSPLVVGKTSILV